jgi:hypothetical protein
MQKKEEEEESIKLFDGITCKTSLYLLTQENPVRVFCYYTMISVYWDRLVIVLIVLSSLKLAVDTYEGSAFEAASRTGIVLA